jgi:hypothetical protein
VPALHLAEGYFGAAGLDRTADVAPRLARLVEKLAPAGVAVLMNGFDHLPADRHTAEVADALADELGQPVRRALLDDLRALEPELGAGTPEFTGELLGARAANLLPGVWSSRMALKLRNRAAETLLTAWAEPWSAIGTLLGLPDERAALALAWQSLIQNQAHDSICGCSIDPVHERMGARYDDAQRLAAATTTRVLERLAGRNATRDTPWSADQTVAVFNPSPHPRTGVARVALEAFPPWIAGPERFDVHPLALAPLEARGFAVDGAPARLIASGDPSRVTFLPGTPAIDVEFVARDIPPFGCRRYALSPAEAAPDRVDGGARIEAGSLVVRAMPDGTLSVGFGGREYRDLFTVVDRGDRGDTYDFDPVDEGGAVTGSPVSIERTVHDCGIQRLRVCRELAVPVGLDRSGRARAEATVACPLTIEATVASGVPFVRVDVEFDNGARDHRLALAFPTGAPVESFLAATTFDTARRAPGPADDTGWIHPAPRTFPHQGWISANGLVIGAPGLPEAEVTADGTVLVTLVRAVGWLSRFELTTRPLPAGPEMATPGAQSLGPMRATFALAATPRDARDAEVGLRAVVAGPDPLLGDGASVLRIDHDEVVLSACKPAHDGDGIILRVLNPTEREHTVACELGVDVASASAVRLDESPAPDPVDHDGRRVRVTVPPHALRSLRVRCDAGSARG